MKNPQPARLWTVSAILCTIVCMALSPNNACACEPDCGDCMHWVGPLPPEPGGHCELNAGATCAEDSDCGTCGRCGGSPCSCSADVQLCNLECDVCDTETQDCYDEDSLCGTENCLDCIAGTCEDRCEGTETPYCDNPNDQCVECLDDPDCAAPDPYCVDGQCVECESNADCGDGLCVDNTCLPPCESDGDCDVGDICVGGICTTPCDGDEDCDGGMVCGGSGGCVQPCDGDGECASGQDCSGGICTDPCTGDGNCAPGQVCSGGGGCTDPCEGDGDCGSNQVCSGQVCTDPCTGGGDCPGSQICAGGVCDDPCSGNDDCASGEACSGGTCNPGCTGDGDCPGGVCVGGVCQDSCTGSGDCGACQQCVNGSCSGPDTTCGDCQSWDNSSCSCESDCTPNQVCDDGICRNTCGPGVSCMTCQTCVNGVCQDNCDNCRTCIDNTCQDDCMTCQRCENETCVDDCVGCQDCVSDSCLDNTNNCSDTVHFTCIDGECICTADDEWGPGNPVPNPIIVEPDFGTVVAPSETVVFEMFASVDTDYHGYCDEDSNEWRVQDPPPSDSIGAITWSASAGSVSGDVTGTWSAPSEPCDATIQVAVDDAGEPYDDIDPGVDSISMKVAEVTVEITSPSYDYAHHVFGLHAGFEPGILYVDIECRITSEHSLEYVFDDLTFDCEAIGNSLKECETPVVMSEEYKLVTGRVKFTGLPENSTDFGVKTLRVKYKGEEKASRPIIVKYRRYNKDNPEGVFPNWFYYWKKDGVVSELLSGDFGYKDESGYGVFIKAENRAYVKNEAPVSTEAEYDVTHRDRLLTKHIGNSGVGIYCCAITCTHELKHKQVFNDWDSLPDFDGDGVPDEKEGIPTHFLIVDCSDTYDIAGTIGDSRYRYYGDEEFIARWAEKSPGPVDASKDWSDPS